MTEQIETDARNENGLTVSRVFSLDDVNPLNSVIWNKRNIEIKNHKTGEITFSQDDVEAPEFWSDLAVTIAASKYFKRSGVPSSTGRETSIKQLINRIAYSIATSGDEQGYFKTEVDASIFEDELKCLLLNQYGAFNSPVWFNAGLSDMYDIKGKGGSHYGWNSKKKKVYKTKSDYEQPQLSACFLMSVTDDLEDIFRLVSDEAKLFKHGSGVGTNVSTLRSKYESLSGGGHSSGVMSFLKMLDVGAGTTKSGGICLAPDQYVYTDLGPAKVKDLVNHPSVNLISYHPPDGRFKFKTASVFDGGRKQLISIKTNTGVFKTSTDHPFKLATGEYKPACELEPGDQLFSCDVHLDSGQLTLNLKNGNTKGLYRVVLQDIYNNSNATTEDFEHQSDVICCVEEKVLLEFSDVYDVSVDCDTEDDKSVTTGHNFVIWSGADYCGTGVVVANTRRAACLRCLNIEHPEIVDFIEWKVKEEKKARALISC
jgi:hypothetical protein